MSLNGKLTPAELTSIDGGQLSNATARAWYAMKVAAKRDGIDLWPASGGAAMYRSYWLQGDMHVHPERYGLNPASSVAIAAAGWSSHGTGTRIDIGSFSGARAAWLLKNAIKFGFWREFGSNDPNHFAHTGKDFPAIPATASVGDTTVIVSDATKPTPFIPEDETMLIKTEKGNYYAYIEGVWDRISRDSASVLRDARGLTTIPELTSAAAKKLFALTAAFQEASIKVDNRDVLARVATVQKTLTALSASVDQIPDETVDALAGRIGQ